MSDNATAQAAHTLNTSQLTWYADNIFYKDDSIRKLGIEGPPGVAKTSLSIQAALRAKHDVIVVHPGTMEPTDVVGLPAFNGNGKVKFCPYGQMDKMLNVDKPTTFIIDDLGQGANLTQAGFMPILDDNGIHPSGQPIRRDLLKFIATTNGRDDMAGVRGILNPLRERFHAWFRLEPDLDAFRRWAFSTGEVPAEVIACLNYKSDLLYQRNPGGMAGSPNPRTWHSLSRQLRAFEKIGKVPDAVRTATFAGIVGEGAAVEFISFLNLWGKLPNPDVIAMDPLGAPLPDAAQHPDQLFALMGSLARKANEDNFDAFAQYVLRIPSDACEFGVVYIKDVIAQHPKLQNTKGMERFVLNTPAFASAME